MHVSHHVRVAWCQKAFFSYLREHAALPARFSSPRTPNFPAHHSVALQIVAVPGGFDPRTDGELLALPNGIRRRVPGMGWILHAPILSSSIRVSHRTLLSFHFISLFYAYLGRIQVSLISRR
ncbi:hypothetical protein PMIN03_010073 [Paraphaeosphaeria minitans]